MEVIEMNEAMQVYGGIEATASAARIVVRAWA